MNVDYLKGINKRMLSAKTKVNKSFTEQEELIEEFNNSNLNGVAFAKLKGVHMNYMNVLLTTRRKTYKMNTDIVLAMQWIYDVKTVSGNHLMKQCEIAYKSGSNTHNLLMTIVGTSDRELSESSLMLWFDANPQHSYDTYKRYLK